MASIVDLVVRVLKAILGLGSSGSQTNSIDKDAPRVKLRWDIVLKEGTGVAQKELPPNSYDISKFVDAKTKTLIDNIYLDIDLGFLKLVREDGLAAVDWFDSSLRPVDLTYDARVKYVFKKLDAAGAEHEHVITKPVRGKNAEALKPSLIFFKGLKLDGLVDGNYFYVKTPIEFEVEIPEIDGIEMAYRYSPSGRAVGYVEKTTYKTTAFLTGVVRMPSAEKSVVEDVDSRAPVVVDTGLRQLIRTSPRVGLWLDDIKRAYSSLLVKKGEEKEEADEETKTFPQFIRFELGEGVRRVGVVVAITVNGEPVAFFDSLSPRSWETISVEFGEKYDVQVYVVIEPHVFPPALWDLNMKITQVRRSGDGWINERDYAFVRGALKEQIDTQMPIGILAHRIVVDRPERGYVVFIDADYGSEELVVSGKVEYGEKYVEIKDLDVKSRVESRTDTENALTPSDFVEIAVTCYGEKVSDEQIQGPTGEGLWFVGGAVITYPLMKLVRIETISEVKKVEVKVKAVKDKDGKFWSLPKYVWVEKVD